MNLATDANQEIAVTPESAKEISNTPEIPPAIFLISQTAPGRLQDPGQDFEIYVDDTLDQEMAIDQETSHSALFESLGADKENEIERTEPINQGQLPLDLSKPILEEVAVSNMAEYKRLEGQGFKVPYSPTSLNFYANRRNSFYSKDVPPPSISTRTVGSAHYRASTINLFGVRKCIQMLEVSSPTTPKILPTHIHSSRLHARRLFPLMYPLQSPVKEVMKIIQGSSFNSPHNSPLNSPQRETVYQLRPRPTPKPSLFVSLVSQSLMNPDNARVQKKKKKSDQKK
jgi:hypothetical protein